MSDRGTQDWRMGDLKWNTCSPQLVDASKLPPWLGKATENKPVEDGP